jgi:haloalkane dehalogenase
MLLKNITYLWRNIMPHLEQQGHVVALDLIGMRQSDKPKHLSQSLPKTITVLSSHLSTKNRPPGGKMTLLLHDWGSALGLHFASKNPDSIQGFAFTEAIVQPIRWSIFPIDSKLGKFIMMRTAVIGWIVEQVFNMLSFFPRQLSAS